MSCRVLESSWSTEYRGYLATWVRWSWASPQTRHRQDQPALLQLQQGALLTAALRRETRKERASQRAKTGPTASAGWNFVVRMVLGRQQPASTPTQPSLVRSILSHRSSPTIQSEYYFLMIATFPFSSHRCGQIPAGCKRCDDECAWRDGKAGRKDYWEAWKCFLSSFWLTAHISWVVHLLMWWTMLIIFEDRTLFGLLGNLPRSICRSISTIWGLWRSICNRPGGIEAFDGLPGFVGFERLLDWPDSLERLIFKMDIYTVSQSYLTEQKRKQRSNCGYIKISYGASLESDFIQNNFFWRRLFDFFDDCDKCRNSGFLRSKNNNIFSPFIFIFSPLWSI